MQGSSAPMYGLMLEFPCANPFKTVEVLRRYVPLDSIRRLLSPREPYPTRYLSNIHLIRLVSWLVSFKLPVESCTFLRILDMGSPLNQ